MRKYITRQSLSLREMSLKNVEAIFTSTAAEVNDNVNLMGIRSSVIDSSHILLVFWLL